MILQRYGRAWEPHEILWAEATLLMTAADRKAAFYDIAELTGRTVRAVEDKAYVIKRAARKPLRLAWVAPQQTGRRLLAASPAPLRSKRRAA